MKLPVNFSPYHTADVDTAWFARSGIPALTFISHNDEGLPTYIHRPEDTIDKVHWKTVDQAIDVAYHICTLLIQQESYAE